MAFFDDLGKKVSQGTRNLADTTRLNGVISDSRKKIDRLYAQLGQAYYEAHKDDEVPEQPELVSELNGLFAGIKQAEDELLQLRSMGRCPKCGAEVSLNAQFCSRCGAKLPSPIVPPAPPAQRFCPGCGAPAAPGNRFCNACGTPLEPAVQQSYQPTPQGFSAPQQPAEEPRPDQPPAERSVEQSEV